MSGWRFWCVIGLHDWKYLGRNGNADHYECRWCGKPRVSWVGKIVPACGAAVLAAACAQIPEKPTEVRTRMVEVQVPVPVPCFTEAERPVLKPPTPIDIDNATTDQLAAALAADKLNEENYTRAVDALFARCINSGAKP